ncbi:AAA family ATPase [Bradyrhizobium sp. CB1650]|uniref:AAA family ATPase n=1 Tax=Bradyrhizobium sp. CB1650 TaxID=3039153 RepID=UPI002434B385|nr:AAA family ATPase [Bradyrhizobium sp. CB1650]WGD48657.1 AAA family ATPase [Bradyrhizobium sp. CB1650]
MADDRIDELRKLLGEAAQEGGHEPWFSPRVLPLLPRPIGAKRSREKSDNTAPTYRFSDAHKRAIQVALLLRQPLLLTGEPGVGKTQSARALAHALGLRYDRFDVKSTTTGRDLLYSFDDVARFRDAAMARLRKASPIQGGLARYVELSALGRAIVLSAGADKEVTSNLSRRALLGDEVSWDGRLTLKQLFPGAFTEQAEAQSLVLIDELDKAPRDTPNDLLVEFEEMRLRIPELGDLQVEADERRWPVLIVTSNSERSLPDPFLRRCVFHHLTLSPESLPEIVLLQLPDMKDDPAVTELIAVFNGIRKDVTGLQKPPSTAELVGAAALLRAWPRRNGGPVDLKKNPDLQQALAGVLGKIKVDIDLIEQYLAKRASPQ